MSRTLIIGIVEGTHELTGKYDKRAVRFYGETNWPWTQVVDTAIEEAFPESGWSLHYEHLDETEVPE